jgi:Fic family protein
MKRYNWQYKKWPQFEYDLSHLQKKLLLLSERFGQLSGALSHLSPDAKSEILIDTLVQEAIKTSAIEGEIYPPEEVLSSIKNHLKLHKKQEFVGDIRADNIAKLILKVRESYQDPLTQKSLFDWHKILFHQVPFSKKISLGKWRTHKEPMQVISARLDKLIVHYEAPPSEVLPVEMKKFIQWFNQTAPGKPSEINSPVVRAAIAHLYFETLHPFEDGNGRIGRVIAEKAFSQGLGRPVLMSLSRAMEAKRKQYYAALKEAQSSLEITPWIEYFIETTNTAQEETLAQIDFILKKSKFFHQYQNQLNERELKVLKRMLKEGPTGFVGGMNVRKYSAITHASKATVTRDLQHLLKLGVFTQMGAGKNTAYEINFERNQD